MFKSIQVKLVALYLPLVFIVMIVTTFYIRYSIERNYIDNLRGEAKKIFNNSSSTIQDVIFPQNNAPKNLEQMEKKLKEARKGIDSIIGENLKYVDRQELYLLNRQGRDITKEDGEIFSSQAVVSAMRGQPGESGTEKAIEFAFPMTYDSSQKEVYGIFLVRSDLEDLNMQLAKINDILLVATTLAMFLTSILGFIFSRTLTGPIQVLTRKAQLMAEGNFTEKIAVKSDDEIGQLTDNFNHMAAVLRQTLQEISGEKQKVETILHHMTDGVIAFNPQGQILHMNPAAKALLKIYEDGLHFDQIFGRFDLNIIFSDFLGDTESKCKPTIICADNKFVHVYFAAYGNRKDVLDGLIVVLQDITEQKKLEDMRKEFVANVSHELRTPLTTIKSYTETLLDGVLKDEEMSQRFLQVVNHEVDRMTRLVQDLLELSRIDNQQVKFNFESMNVGLMVKRIVESQQMTLEDSGQKLQCFIMGDIPNITADRHRIEQVLINILNNSIKYSGVNTTIKTLVEKYKSMVKIQVIDNGAGIPEKDLPRIFERFYRVDKARSRQLGGTGLGLAIAKEIIESHGGEIYIDSEEGKGTKVTLLLPI